MAFLRNAWYVAALAREVKDAPMERTLLNEQVCLYRGESGGVYAVQNRCPHRFAPFDMGKVVGDNIQCPYHGLQFNGQGECVRNPHGDGVIARGARTPYWPVVERHSMIWIWMGDPARADPALIPDYSILDRPDRFDYAHLYMSVKGNYQLVVDNLLDLSHVEYLHPYLINPSNPGRSHYEMQGDDRTVVSIYTTYGTDLPGLYAETWPNATPLVDSVAEMTWKAPSFCFGRMRARPAGANEWDESSLAPNMHMITPETDTTCHYFWAGGYNIESYTPERSETFKTLAYNIFTREDLPVISRVQQAMGDADLMSLRPLILSVDTAALRARRILSNLIRDEQAQLEPVSA